MNILEMFENQSPKNFPLYGKYVHYCVEENFGEKNFMISFIESFKEIY